MSAFKKIKKDKGQWYKGVVDAIFQEWIGSSSQEFKMPAEKNERGDVPAHDKYTQRRADNGRTHCIYLTQVFRSQEQ